MDAEKKKYNQMENVLQYVNKNYISLPANEKKRNNTILEQATEHITSLIKEKDVLFKNVYERKFYGGSYYDGIKVGKPEEYDLDYVLKLPVIIEPVLEASDKPGFIHLKITEYRKLLNREEASKFPKLDALMDTQNYLSTSKVLQWMERAITHALNNLPKEAQKGYRLDIKFDDQENTLPVYATLSKAHPAFTLTLKNKEKGINMDIDLVPCFQFTDNKWPKEEDGYRQNPFSSKKKFLIVPKRPNGMDECDTLGRYWRLSFQEQERELIKGHEYKSMKPTIRLLKKLRDKQNHVKIASYYIKTIFLWEAQGQPQEFWQQSSSYVLMQMLKKYADMVQNKCIPYFWNERYNLIGHLKDVTLTGIGNTLRNIVDDIERNLEDPFVVAKYLIDQNDAEAIRGVVKLGKTKKQQSPSQIWSSPTSSQESQNSETLLLSLNTKMDEVLYMLSNLTSRMSRLEEDVAELHAANGKAKPARGGATAVKKPAGKDAWSIGIFDDVLGDIDRLSLTARTFPSLRGENREDENFQGRRSLLFDYDEIHAGLDKPKKIAADNFSLNLR